MGPVRVPRKLVLCLFASAVCCACGRSPVASGANQRKLPGRLMFVDAGVPTDCIAIPGVPADVVIVPSDFFLCIEDWQVEVHMVFGDMKRIDGTPGQGFFVIDSRTEYHEEFGSASAWAQRLNDYGVVIDMNDPRWK